MKPIVPRALIILVCCIGAVPADCSAKPFVLPPKLTPFDHSYGEWADRYNNWVWQLSAEESPFLAGDDGSNCDQGQAGKVWFLAGALEGTVVREGCVIPAGTALFFPVAGSVSFVPTFGLTEDEIREDAADDVALVESFTLEVDGVPLPAYRASSPKGGFVLSAPEGSLLADLVGAGDYEPTVADGYWVMLAPLSHGPHTIQYSVSLKGQEAEAYDVTHEIIVD